MCHISNPSQQFHPKTVNTLFEINQSYKEFKIQNLKFYNKKLVRALLNAPIQTKFETQDLYLSFVLQIQITLPNSTIEWISPNS